MDKKDWIVLPQKTTPIELDDGESYAKLLVLRHEIEKERGDWVTDKQVAALQKLITSLIEAGAHVKVYRQE